MILLVLWVPCYVINAVVHDTFIVSCIRESWGFSTMTIIFYVGVFCLGSISFQFWGATGTREATTESLRRPSMFFHRLWQWQGWWIWCEFMVAVRKLKDYVKIWKKQSSWDPTHGKRTEQERRQRKLINMYQSDSLFILERVLERVWLCQWSQKQLREEVQTCLLKHFSSYPFCLSKTQVDLCKGRPCSCAGRKEEKKSDNQRTNCESCRSFFEWRTYHIWFILAATKNRCPKNAGWQCFPRTKRAACDSVWWTWAHEQNVACCV